MFSFTFCEGGGLNFLYETEFFLTGPFPASFCLYSRLFNTVDRKYSIINFAYDWIRTADLLIGSARSTN